MLTLWSRGSTRMEKDMSRYASQISCLVFDDIYPLTSVVESRIKKLPQIDKIRNNSYFTILVWWMTIFLFPKNILTMAWVSYLTNQYALGKMHWINSARNHWLTILLVLILNDGRVWNELTIRPLGFKSLYCANSCQNHNVYHDNVEMGSEDVL